MVPQYPGGGWSFLKQNPSRYWSCTLFILPQFVAVRRSLPSHNALDTMQVRIGLQTFETDYSNHKKHDPTTEIGWYVNQPISVSQIWLTEFPGEKKQLAGGQFPLFFVPFRNKESWESLEGPGGPMHLGPGQTGNQHYSSLFLASDHVML